MSYKIFILILIIKVCSVLYLVHLLKCSNPEIIKGIASYWGDANSYIAPMDHFISEGNYYYETVKAGRMPYLGLVYLPFRLAFSKEVALSILVILQILLECIAIYYMAKLCENIFKGKFAFYTSLFLSCLSLNVTIYDYAILSEAFGISFLCLFVFNYHCFLTSGRSKKDLLLVGLFLALSVLFKPYFSLFFLVIGLELMWYERGELIKKSFRKIVIQGILVSIPLFILDGSWTVRNYILLEKFIPFQQDIYAGYRFTDADKAYVAFLKNIGESYIYWDKKSAGSYFQGGNEFKSVFTFPARIFGQHITMKQIEDVKQTYMKYKQNGSDSLEKQAINQFNFLSDNYRNDHLFFSRFGVPLILCKNLLINSGSYYLPIKQDSPCYHSFQFLIKIFQSFLYYFTLIVGSIGLIKMLFAIPNTFILALIPLYLILFFPLYLRQTEWRYFVPSYPFLSAGSTYVLLILKNKWYKPAVLK